MACVTLLLLLSLVLSFASSEAHSPIEAAVLERGKTLSNKSINQQYSSDANSKRQLLDQYDGAKSNYVNNTLAFDHDSWQQHNEKMCPTWMYRSNASGYCQCGSDINGAVKCNATLNQVVTDNCMTYDEYYNEVITGECLYGCILGFVYETLPLNVSQLNEVMCGRLNRQGRLCSKCEKEHYPLVYSYEFNCVKCTSGKYNWVKYIAVVILLTTCFYILIHL